MFSLHSFRFPILLVLLLIICAGVAGCGTSSNAATTYNHNTPEASVVPRVSPTPSPTPSATPTPTYVPTHLIVPSVGINAPVETIGILANGELDTPSHSPWTDTGWYKDGPLPGEQGSAVIDGHLDRPGGYPAVFWLLRNMQKGDDVQVLGSTGKTLHFRVTAVVYYAPTAAPIQQIFGNTSGKYLNLITCAGDWIPSEHQTTLRLVVYTTLVS